METSDISFTDSPLKNYIHRAEINEKDDLELADALLKKNNLTKIFFKDIDFRMLLKKNYILQIYGDIGTGKSIIAQYTGKYTENFVLNSPQLEPAINEIEEKFGRKPVFDKTNICFDTSELNARTRECVPFETFVYDEAGSEKIVGTGSQREKADKERILKRVRGDQNNFIFCDPLTDETKLADLYLYRLRTFDIDYINELNRSLLEAKNLFGTWGIYGHIVTQKYTVDGYLEKKDAQIKAIKKFEFGGGRIALWEKLADDMMAKGIENYLFQDWSYMIDEWTNQNYTKDEVKNIIKKIRFKTARIKNTGGKNE